MFDVMKYISNVFPSSSKLAVDSDEGAVAVFGVLSDVQYANVDDKHYAVPGRDRYYRNSVKLMKKAVEEWNKVKNMKFFLQLGDLIDSQSRMLGQADVALNTVLKEFESANVNRLPLLHIWGNHEMYCFDRVCLVDSALNTAKAIGGNAHDANANYYRYDVTSNLSIICLDMYRFSILGYRADDPEYQEAFKLMRRFSNSMNE